MDIGKHTIEIECPKCRFLNPIYFKQARLRDVIICRGCKSNIQLDDQMNECRKAIRCVNKSIRELEKSFLNQKITISL